MDGVEITFRLIVLGDPKITGQTAASPELAMLVPGAISIEVRAERLGMERTEWGDHFGKPKPLRTVVIRAETHAGEWAIGPY